VTTGGHFQAEITKLTEGIDESIQEMVSDVYEKLLAFSPTPMNSRAGRSKGSYVQSHRIGINLADITHTNLGRKAAPDFSSVEKARQETVVIEKIKLGDTITISNTIPWAEKVEYKGWGGDSKPYRTYAQTRSYVRSKYGI